MTIIFRFSRGVRVSFFPEAGILSYLTKEEGTAVPDRLAKSLSLLLTAAGAVGALWLGARFVLPWTAPFLAAWVMAALLERPVAFL